MGRGGHSQPAAAAEAGPEPQTSQKGHSETVWGPDSPEVAWGVQDHPRQTVCLLTALPQDAQGTGLSPSFLHPTGQSCHVTHAEVLGDGAERKFLERSCVRATETPPGGAVYELLPRPPLSGETTPPPLPQGALDAGVQAACPGSQAEGTGRLGQVCQSRPAVLCRPCHGCPR